ncbi:membrane-spanning 4-domains subfamily A member 4A-like isoform X1 [Epinephelus lanceolatus]|uniref:high affinity immunoglobulin epsilon receptor subunit beta-like isoform X1 n=1 Tax=Epinephelus lanceolatus TaxID=310571 RepID=UPI0014484155|nr:high affinity immunoglobulin epsilon receptor subunit beta-like isoform X1 [Epinephelus lanceolatus]
MSFTVVKNKGVTVITVAADEKSMLPPLCQIMKSLCYSPICCSVNRGMIQTSVAVALGTIQVMVGLFNIGLGPGRTSLHPDDFAHLGAAYWLGGVFILAGIMSILAGRFPSRCLVISSVVINIIGSLITIAGVVLYAIDIFDVTGANMCDWERYKSREDNDNCTSVMHFFQHIVVAMDITMIVLTVLQLCVSINMTLLGIKGVCTLRKGTQGGRADEVDQPLLKEVLMTSPGA